VRTLRSLIVLFALLGLALAACRKAATPTPTPTATPVPTQTPFPPTATLLPPTATTIPPATAGTPRAAVTATTAAIGGRLDLAGDCVNPYFPIREGTTLTYGGPPFGESEISHSLTFSDVSENGFTVTQSFENVTTEIRWTCSKDGLLSSQFMQFQLAQLGDVEFESTEFTGVTLPPADRWDVGLTWTSGYSATGKMNILDVGTVNTQIEITIDNKIAAQEQIVVSAGTFPDAMRVDSTATLLIYSKFGEMALPPAEISFPFSNWYVKNVGMVRSASSGQEIPYVTELLSVD
jgi:hypothetical protein